MSRLGVSTLITNYAKLNSLYARHHEINLSREIFSQFTIAPSVRIIWCWRFAKYIIMQQLDYNYKPVPRCFVKNNILFETIVLNQIITKL